MAYGTTDRLTGGTASASTIYGAGYEASKAVDNNEATKWTTQAGVGVPHYWIYDCGAGVTWAFGKLRFMCDADMEINAFNANGSNNGADYTALYSGNGVDTQSWQEFIWVNSVAYRYLKINITSKFGVSLYVGVFEFEAMEMLPGEGGAFLLNLI